MSARGSCGFCLGDAPGEGRGTGAVRGASTRMRHTCVDKLCALKALLRDSGLQGQSGLFLASALHPGCKGAARGLGPATEPGDR